jgi:NAD(P)-dependent dehydrogenase (short-subunit alcohol dehydrogenase family)
LRTYSSVPAQGTFLNAGPSNPSVASVASSPHNSRKKGLKKMADKRVWFITGAGRGMGVDIAKAALAAGHAVVATGRNTSAVSDAVGEADDLLVVELDITSLASAEAAVQAALERFGRIDVLVNNAGNFYAGYFEELTPEQIERSLTTNLVGPMNVTRAVLPVMRKQRSGNVVTITSTAGIVGQEFCSAYAASKFGLEGWMESLRFEVEPFGIHTTIVEPGFFRTELLEKESTAYAELSIDDYAERTAQTRPAWEAMSGKQGGDPAKLAKALVTVVDEEQPPLRWVAGADAVETVERKARELLAQVDAHRELSTALAFDEPADGSQEGRSGA